MTLLAVGIGGFLGAIARYLCASRLQERVGLGFPIGTLFVNVLGCFLMGALMETIHSRELFSPKLRLAMGAGFLGSLTTFSTFGYETLEMSRGGELRLPALNVLANVVIGLAALTFGQFVARVFGAR